MAQRKQSKTRLPRQLDAVRREQAAEAAEAERAIYLAAMEQRNVIAKDMECPRCGSGSLHVKWTGPDTWEYMRCMYCGLIIVSGKEPERDQKDCRPIKTRRVKEWVREPDPVAEDVEATG